MSLIARRDISSGTREVGRIRDAFDSAAKRLSKALGPKVQQGRALGVIMNTEAAITRSGGRQPLIGVGFKRGREEYAAPQRHAPFHVQGPARYPPNNQPAWHTGPPSYRPQQQPPPQPKWEAGPQSRELPLSQAVQMAAMRARGEVQGRGRGSHRGGLGAAAPGDGAERQPKGARMSDQERHYNNFLPPRSGR